MARNKHWNETETNLLTGALESFGNPNGWTEEQWNHVKAQLTQRSQSGIYQRAMAMLREKKGTAAPVSTLQMAKGA